MSTSNKASPSNSGIRTDASGAAYIPSSVRPDGSTRKQIRVRPGYRPPEDVEVYKNRTAQAWKSRGKGGVPGAEPVAEAQAAKSKNAKRREAARSKATSEDTAADEDGLTNKDHANGTNKQQESKPGASAKEAGAVNEEAEQEKKARNLRKKLRQARDLQGKKEQGESLLPEQFAKVLKIQELIRDLNKLGFDEEEQNKAGDGG